MKTKIIIVDAHPVYASKVAGFLESLTFKNITIIDSGLKAVESIEQHKPDLIIHSAVMPDANAVELACSIKKQWPAIPMIVQTGLLTSQETIEAFKSGGIEYIIPRREKDWSLFVQALDQIFKVPVKYDGV